MTMPTGSDPSGYDLSGHDGGVVGAGLGNLAGRTRGPIEEMLKQRVQNTSSLNNASDAIFHGLNAALGLPLAILEALVNRLFPGLNINLDEGMEAFLNSLKEVPLLGDIVKWITGIADGGIAELKLWFDNLKKFLAHIDFNSPSFNPLAAAADFIDMILAPVGKLATLIGGLLSGSVIPGLDASKIVSGQFAQDMIAGLGGVLNGINSMINQVIDIFRGVLVTPINQALQDVKDWWNAITGKTSHLNGEGGYDASKLVGEVAKSAVEGLVDLGNVVVGGFQAITNGWFGGSSATGSPAEVRTTIEAIKQAVINGYTVDTIVSSQSYEKPAANLSEVFVIGIGAGSNGFGGSSGTTSAGGAAGSGGLNGGFLKLGLDPSAITWPVDVTIGTNGNETSFGSYLTTVAGAGGIQSKSEFAFLATSSTPGSGGAGGTGGYKAGTSANYGTTGRTGVASASAGGGTGGSPSALPATNGTAGESVSAGVDTKCGGGGGGGGGGGNPTGTLAQAKGGNGGAGGYPGGGGGGGGGGAGYDTGSKGSGGTGGPGASGVLWVFWKEG
ncbi:Uncharacterised protein [Mycobacteroides abscessus subsp. massiliense]|uniref:hypothetical protein n=1 Tax=Mycobacteroides abscessus TaxID=36809 RepID=UPI0009D479D3|nr:hypothetical protein [Mycobacteroides abscessus]SLH92181.1 Uncharacterised protein [Mycobacteroides abscessus subsp. massiliense]SLI30897.1 Uncharacterised protein [Mycobacteroides abscessus subsp. massiliense]